MDLEYSNEKLSLVPQSLEVLMEKNFPSNQWLVDGLIPSQAITILSGAPTSCKTWIMLEIATCVAQGKDLFDRFPTKQTGVLIIDEESGERLLQDRFRTLRTLKDLPIYCLSMCGRKISTSYVEEIIKWCQENKVSLIMIDSLVRIHDGDENAARDIAKLFGLIRKFTVADLSVLIAHHNRKSNNRDVGPQQMRGSSDILASIDCQIAVNRPHRNELLTMEQTKCRIAPELPLLEIKFNQYNDYSEFEFLGQKDVVNKKLAFRNTLLK